MVWTYLIWFYMWWSDWWELWTILDENSHTTWISEVVLEEKVELKDANKLAVRVRLDGNRGNTIHQQYPKLIRYFEDHVLKTWPIQIEEHDEKGYSSYPRITKVMWSKKNPEQIVLGIYGNRQQSRIVKFVEQRKIHIFWIFLISFLTIFKLFLIIFQMLLNLFPYFPTYLQKVLYHFSCFLKDF